MNRFQHVMVGLANTAADAGLIRYAAAVARLGNAREFRFAHVVSPTEPGKRDHDRALAQMQAAVGDHFLDCPRDVRTHFDVLKGPLEDRLLGYALEQESDLILVGHGQGRSGRKSLGRRLAMEAPCSLWMVPEGSSPTFSRVLVPVDYSEPSADAFGVAAALVRQTGARELLALHVYFDDVVHAFEDHAATLRGQMEAEMAAFLEKAPGPTVPVRTLFEQAMNVPHAITRVAEAQAANLIVMSTRGRSPSAAVLLGSVTEDVIIETKQPLVVVKHFGAKLGLLQALLQAGERDGSGPHYN